MASWGRITPMPEKRIRPIDIPEDLLQHVADQMRKWPEIYDADGSMDPSEVDTDVAADFICRRPWRFADLEDGSSLCPWPPSECRRVRRPRRR